MKRSILITILVTACSPIEPADPGGDAGDGDHTLSVTRAGDGDGDVTATPGGVDCGDDCVGTYPAGAEVALTATPAEGSTFAGWSGACAGTGACVVLIDGDREVTATFARGLPVANLTVTQVGPGAGSVASTPGGIDCGDTCAATFPRGEAVTLTATPAAGSLFTGWRGACVGTTPSCELSLDADAGVLARFAPGVTLAVHSNGGRIAVDTGATEVCAGDCTYLLLDGSPVTVTAEHDPARVFMGWFGTVCSETSVPTCSFTMSGAEDVSANFCDAGDTCCLDPSDPICTCPPGDACCIDPSDPVCDCLPNDFCCINPSHPSCDPTDPP